MALEPFRKIWSDNRVLNMVQDLISNAFQSLYNDDFLSRQKIAVSLATGTNVIYHNLKRIPSGWILTDRNGTATVYRSAWDSTTITLVASAALTVSLEVF
jgi:hypothetical protein